MKIEVFVEDFRFDDDVIGLDYVESNAVLDYFVLQFRGLGGVEHDKIDRVRIEGLLQFADQPQVDVGHLVCGDAVKVDREVMIAHRPDITGRLRPEQVGQFDGRKPSEDRRRLFRDIHGGSVP